MGIPYYLWIHEFDDIPARFLVKGDRVNFDDPELFPYLDQRYERLLALRARQEELNACLGQL